MRLALPGSTTDPRQKRGRALSPEAHHPPIFFFSLSFLSNFYYYYFLIGYGWYWGRSGEIRALPYTGGLATPWQMSSNPLSSPSTWLFLYFLKWSGGYGYQKFAWPGPQGPQPVGSRITRFLGGLFSRNPCSSPVRGSGISQESGEVVASCWGWPPSPFPDYFP